MIRCIFSAAGPVVSIPATSGDFGADWAGFRVFSALCVHKKVVWTLSVPLSTIYTQAQKHQHSSSNMRAGHSLILLVAGLALVQCSIAAEQPSDANDSPKAGIQVSPGPHQA